MHELFANILNKRDLSRAGELFSIADDEIIDDISTLLQIVTQIVSQPQYLESSNDQSLIEICLNRITSCINHETDSAEKNCIELVKLLAICLHFNLKPNPVGGVDPPHSKVTSDILSCLFLNYNKKAVMEHALPVAVKFLKKENKEMSRNLASYLSLAAIEYANLLLPYCDIILDSLLIDGNYKLARVVLELYEISNELEMTEPISNRTRSIIDILPKCETIDKNILLQLISTIIQSNNNRAGVSLLIDKLPQFFDLILSSSTAIQSLMVLLSLAEKMPLVFSIDYIGLLIHTAQKLPITICLIAQILAASGRKDKEKAEIALNFILENLPNTTDRASQTTMLQEAVSICSQYPILFNDKLTAVIHGTHQKIKTDSISGNVTIVKLNATSNKSHLDKPIQASRRPPKFGDSRSTGRLHTGIANYNTQRLNVSNNSNLGGLHKNSVSRLSSSQQIHLSQSSNFIQLSTIPPLSQHVTITGQNKWGIPSTKITSGGVTVNHISPMIRTRLFSQPQGLIGILGSSYGALGKSSSNGLGVLNHSTGSISVYNPAQNNNVSVHHASPSPLVAQPSILSLAPPPAASANMNSKELSINQVIVSGPSTTRKGSNNKSITLLNANSVNHRMSVFEPSIRDTIQHFSEKHLDKIKTYMQSISHRVPPAAKCTIEERRSKKFVKLHFACQLRGPHCLYSKTVFSMRTRFAKFWIHLMFLDLQSRSEHALSSYDSSVASLKHCWDTLKAENRTFITLVTSAFPPIRDQDLLINELRNAGFFDVFEIGQVDDIRWNCFLCSHPEKAIDFVENNTQPVIEGQLKEKRGKWRLFRRWHTKYFTLSNAHLSYKGSSGDTSIDVNQIRSVKVSRNSNRNNIPKCFEIFTGNQTLILKPTGDQAAAAEEWVQYLSIIVARQSQARDGFSNTKTNSLPSSSGSRLSRGTLK